jgi:excisionase family DNA binding protein
MTADKGFFMATTIEREYLTPPQAATLLGVHHDSVLTWIHSGELRASDLTATRGARPRWRIHRADLEAFLQRRAAKPPAKRQTRPRRQRQTAGDVIQFYK